MNDESIHGKRFRLTDFQIGSLKMHGRENLAHFFAEDI